MPVAIFYIEVGIRAYEYLSMREFDVWSRKYGQFLFSKISELSLIHI